jgi:hypothetical protein
MSRLDRSFQAEASGMRLAVSWGGRICAPTDSKDDDKAGSGPQQRDPFSVLPARL